MCANLFKVVFYKSIFRIIYASFIYVGTVKLLRVTFILATENTVKEILQLTSIQIFSLS